MTTPVVLGIERERKRAVGKWLVGRAASCRPVSVIESWTVDGRVKSPNPLSRVYSLTKTPTLKGRTSCCERGGNPRFVDRKKPLSLSKLRLAARRLFTLESLFFAAPKTSVYVYFFRRKLWVPLFFSAGRSSPAHPTDCHREKDERLRDDSGGGGFGAVWLGEGGVWDRATTTKAAIIIASQLEVLDVEGGEEPTSLPKLPLPPPPPPFPLFLLRLVWSKHLSALSLALSPAEKRLQRAPYIFQRIRTPTAERSP